MESYLLTNEQRRDRPASRNPTGGGIPRTSESRRLHLLHVLEQAMAILEDDPEDAMDQTNSLVVGANPNNVGRKHGPRGGSQ